MGESEAAAWGEGGWQSSDRAIPFSSCHKSSNNNNNYCRQMFPLNGGEGKAQPIKQPYKIQRSHICYGSFNNFWERRWAGTKCDTWNRKLAAAGDAMQLSLPLFPSLLLSPRLSHTLRCQVKPVSFTRSNCAHTLIERFDDRASSPTAGSGGNSESVVCSSLIYEHICQFPCHY